jgi:hypothetical protein
MTNCFEGVDGRDKPGHDREALKGNRAGQWSIRINDQWRIVFAGTKEGRRCLDSRLLLTGCPIRIPAKSCWKNS